MIALCERLRWVRRRCDSDIETLLKRKEFISFLLLTVYLLLVGLPAVVSLTCPCVAHATRIGGCGSSCGASSCCAADHHAHYHHPDHAHLQRGCDCNHSHNMEVELYILPSQNDERQAVRCAVFEVPAVIACEVPIFDFNLYDYRRVRIRSDREVSQPQPTVQGLRAPPVCA